MVTMKDIAAAAGVSPMTVSHVLNDHPHVRDSTRQRVLIAIDDLGYRVNIAARNLRRGRTHTIGLAVPEIDRPYFGQLAALIIDYAGQHELEVLIEQTGRSREHELDALSRSRQRMYDGLILSAVGLSEFDAELLRVDYPVVILGERMFNAPVDHVAMPNVTGAAAAVDHLIAQGCRRIVSISGSLAPTADMSSLRHAGYREALARADLPLLPELVVELDGSGLEDGARAIRQLVDQGVSFDGVFCVTDYVAVGVSRALADAGIDVPGSVKLIGFDDMEISEYLTPSLSSIRPDHEFMAKSAVDLLISRIDGDKSDPREVVSPYRLSRRESTR